jgi:membrane-associated phospholipid phosphatase
MSTVRVGLIAFALYSFGIAALMVFLPHVFFTDIGPFGVQNDHYLRDTATFNAAFGVALLVAYRRVEWRTPILYCIALQFLLHSINHLVDIGAAHPYWLGPADFISLALATVALMWLARESTQPLEAQR